MVGVSGFELLSFRILSLHQLQTVGITCFFFITLQYPLFFANAERGKIRVKHRSNHLLFFFAHHKKALPFPGGVAMSGGLLRDYAMQLLLPSEIVTIHRKYSSRNNPSPRCFLRKAVHTLCNNTPTNRYREHNQNDNLCLYLSYSDNPLCSTYEL